MDFILTQFSSFGGAFYNLASDPITYIYLISSVFLGIVFGPLSGLTTTLAVTILTGFLEIKSRWIIR
jgi:putative tricarboxylic transport membrane protein|tara:strand:+ start:196 stop:396 length:201 start_codon:yes stop_codon:yes gene_type:complete